MRNKLDTVCFNYDPFGAKRVEDSLKSSYDKVERCYSSPWSPYRCFKDGNIFVVKPDGALLSEEPFDSFEVYGKNFFVGKRMTGTTDWSNSPKLDYTTFDCHLNVLCVSTAEPEYLGWRIMACQSGSDGIRLFNPCGEIKCDYKIREVKRFGDYGTCNGMVDPIPAFAVFAIVDPSTLKRLYGLLNIYGEVALKPEYDIIEFDSNGNMKASKQEKTYNGKWHSVYFDKFLHATPTFLQQYESFYVLSKSLYGVTNNEGLVGVVNNQNALIVPFEYKSIYGLDNGLAIFRRENENGVIRLCDNKIVASSPQYDFEICDGEIICRYEGRRTMFCNIAKAETEWYDKIEPLFNRYFKVRQGFKYGIIDSKGEQIVPVDYECILVSDEFMLLVEKDRFSYGDIADNDVRHSVFGDNITVLSRDFTPLTNYDFDIKSFEKTAVSTYIIKSYRGYGVLDAGFHVVIPPIFESMRYADSEYVSEKGSHSMDGRFVFENDRTIKVIDSKYSYCEPINDGYFRCMCRPDDICDYRSYRFGVLNADFNEVVPPDYQRINPTFQDDLFLVQAFNGKWGVVDADNEVVVAVAFDAVAPIEASRSFIVSNNSNRVKCYGLYRSDGTEILSCQYSFIGKESAGYRTVFKDDVRGIVNISTGVIISFPDVAYVGVVKENILSVNKGGDLTWRDNIPCVSNGKWGYMDILGNEVIPCIYEGASAISHHLAAVKKDGKWGVVRLDNTEFIPFGYGSISILDNAIRCYVGEYEYDVFNFEGEKTGIGKDVTAGYGGSYDPDSWGANAELDYIGNNGGDWIDD